MSRYDDMRAWLDSERDEAIAKQRARSRESVWRRPLTNMELFAFLVAWLAVTAAVLVFGAVVLRW